MVSPTLARVSRSRNLQIALGELQWDLGCLGTGGACRVTSTRNEVELGQLLTVLVNRARVLFLFPSLTGSLVS